MNFRVGDVVRHEAVDDRNLTLTQSLGRELWLDNEGDQISESFFTLVTPKFEVGDRVKDNLGTREGTLVEQCDSYSPENPCWVVDMPNNPRAHCYFSDLTRISLAEEISQEETKVATEEKRTPQIGDRVRITGVKYPEEETGDLGLEGELLFIDTDDQPYKVRIGEDYWDYFWATEVEVVEATPIVPEGYVRAEDVYRVVMENTPDLSPWERLHVVEALETIGVKKAEPSTTRLQIELDVPTDRLDKFKEWAETATPTVGGTPISNITLKEV